MRASTTSHNSYAAQNPAVPLSVYKELAAQLQAAQTKLNLLNAENEALVEQNQQLRQEVEKAVQAVLHLHQQANTMVVVDRYTASESPTRHRRSKANRGASPKAKAPKIYTEQEQGRYQRRVASAHVAEMSGWGLAIAILVIIASAFGTGFLIVRPLLSGR